MATISAEWPPKEELEQNRAHLLRELEQKLRRYEVRYELSSDRLEAELEAGRLRETAEICDWFIALQSYRSLKNDRQAQLE